MHECRCNELHTGFSLHFLFHIYFSEFNVKYWTIFFPQRNVSVCFKNVIYIYIMVFNYVARDKDHTISQTCGPCIVDNCADW